LESFAHNITRTKKGSVVKEEKMPNKELPPVNAASAEDSPILIGKSRKPRCFTKLQGISRSCGAQYFNNDKAWMRTDIMTNVLTKLNSKRKRESRHIIQFLDNASCHPSSLKGMLSNVQIEFLPKNTRPLNAGIIIDLEDVL